MTEPATSELAAADYHPTPRALQRSSCNAATGNSQRSKYQTAPEGGRAEKQGNIHRSGGRSFHILHVFCGKSSALHVAP